MVFLGNPEYGCELHPIDFVTVARGFGLNAYMIDDPANCAQTLQQAMSAAGPTLIGRVGGATLLALWALLQRHL